ncbi:hypothetical protein FHG87_012532 [Trinorchestia longiramus]|nr:hypothetical protein FHG87_012532 [Trinorchestia longiramus]
MNRCARVPRYRSSRSLRPPRSSVGVVESDSVNESFSPASRPANMRRKPKCKRLALDVAGDTVNAAPSRSARWRTAAVVHRVHALHTPVRWSVLCGGKRKRSREGGGSESRGEGDELLLSSWSPTVGAVGSPAPSRHSRCNGADAGTTRSGSRRRVVVATHDANPPCNCFRRVVVATHDANPPCNCFRRVVVATHDAKQNFSTKINT